MDEKNFSSQDTPVQNFDVVTLLKESQRTISGPTSPRGSGRHEEAQLMHETPRKKLDLKLKLKIPDKPALLDGKQHWTLQPADDERYNSPSAAPNFNQRYDNCHDLDPAKHDHDKKVDSNLTDSNNLDFNESKDLVAGSYTLRFTDDPSKNYLVRTFSEVGTTKNISANRRAANDFFTDDVGMKKFVGVSQSSKPQPKQPPQVTKTPPQTKSVDPLTAQLVQEIISEILQNCFGLLDLKSKYNVSFKNGSLFGVGNSQKQFSFKDFKNYFNLCSASPQPSSVSLTPLLEPPAGRRLERNLFDAENNLFFESKESTDVGLIKANKNFIFDDRRSEKRETFTTFRAFEGSSGTLDKKTKEDASQKSKDPFNPLQTSLSKEADVQLQDLRSSLEQQPSWSPATKQSETANSLLDGVRTANFKKNIPQFEVVEESKTKKIQSVQEHRERKERVSEDILSDQQIVTKEKEKPSAKILESIEAEHAQGEKEKNQAECVKDSDAQPQSARALPASVSSK